MFDPEACWITVERNGTLLVANLGAEPARVSLPGGAGSWRLEASSNEAVADRDGDAEGIELPGMSTAFLLERSAAST
jgi:hypothetical protein